MEQEQAASPQSLLIELINLTSASKYDCFVLSVTAHWPLTFGSDWPQFQVVFKVRQLSGQAVVQLKLADHFIDIFHWLERLVTCSCLASLVQQSMQSYEGLVEDLMDNSTGLKLWFLANLTLSFVIVRRARSLNAGWGAIAVFLRSLLAFMCLSIIGPRRA